MLGLERMIADDPNMRCSFYALSGPWSGASSKRTLSSKNPPKIKNLFQGSNARTNYPGARALVSAETVTFQLHRYDVQTANKKRTLDSSFKLPAQSNWAYAPLSINMRTISISLQSPLTAFSSLHLVKPP